MNAEEQILRVTRNIALYQTTGNRLCHIVPLTHAEFAKIRKMLGFRPTDEMYDCYKLHGPVLTSVQDLLGNRLPHGNYDYFLEAQQE